MEVYEKQGSFYKNAAVKYGILGGIAAIFISIVYYFVDVKLMFRPSTSSMPFIVAMAFAMFAAISRKNSQGGFLAFSQGVITSCLAFLISLIIYTVFTLILMLVIDTKLLDTYVDFQREAAMKYVDNKTYTEEAVNKQIQNVEKNKAGYTIMGGFISIFVFGLIGCVIFLISSAIIKKEPRFYDRN